MTKTSDLNDWRDAYDDALGTIEVTVVPDGRVYSWNGGDVARVSDELTPEFRDALTEELLPWPLLVGPRDPWFKATYVMRTDRGSGVTDG